MRSTKASGLAKRMEPPSVLILLKTCVIENFGLQLKGFANRTISEERSHTERFSTSMLDGIDLRETVRNWHEGALFVRETAKRSGDIGAVVIIFDEDREDKYTYLTTWLGEHQNESDMAFYSTPPFRPHRWSRNRQSGVRRLADDASAEADV